MSRDKQTEIEEMAKDLCPLYEDYGSCKKCDEELDIEDEPCLYECMFKLCIEKGYRKASEVAEEIFAEIEYLIWQHDTHPAGELTEEIAELKKKYTQEK